MREKEGTSAKAQNQSNSSHLMNFFARKHYKSLNLTYIIPLAAGGLFP